MAKRKYNRSNGGRVRTKLPFIQNDICPSTDNLAPGDFFPEAQKSPDPLLPSPSAQTDWSTDRLCRLDLSGAPAQFQPVIRPEDPEAEVTPCLSGRLDSPDGLRPPSACGVEAMRRLSRLQGNWTALAVSALSADSSAQRTWRQGISRLSADVWTARGRLQTLSADCPPGESGRG